MKYEEVKENSTKQYKLTPNQKNDHWQTKQTNLVIKQILNKTMSQL